MCCKRERKIGVIYLGAHFLSVVYGLGAALSFGAGDFAGGIVTKKSPVFSVIIFSQMTGGLMLLALLLS